ncbi:MAG TPA: cell wall-binding repeat-containing protein, partial [Micromonosporaceae bacterium]
MFSGLSLGRRRTGWAAAAAVAVGTAITIVAINGASASHAGSGSVGLSATNGTKTISWQGGTPAALTLSRDTVTDGAWSPDGSRMAFVNQNGALETVRYNSASDTGMYAEADGDARSRPTWTDDGSFLLWSAQVTDDHGTHDIIQFGTGDTQGWNTINLDSGTNWTFPDGGAGTTILVQGEPTGGGVTSIYSIDELNLFDDTVTPTLVQSNASSPAAGPLDNSVAYIASDGSHAQVWVKPGGGGAAVQVTSDAVDHSNPTWSPDGKTIAFDEGTSVFTAPAAGGTPTPANLTGVPAYQTKFADKKVRFAGQNRYETAISVSEGNWADAGSDVKLPANAVVLSRGDTFADALGGSSLAAAKQGPLLLTPPTSLLPATATEIKRVLGSDTSKTVYLVGGTGALSTGVENSVKALGYHTSRLSGLDRYGTAVAVANAINLNPDLVLVATGLKFPDALSAGAVAGAFDVPGTGLSAVVVLSANDLMPTTTKSYLEALDQSANGPTKDAIGGSAVTALSSLDLPNSFGIGRRQPVRN